MELLKLVIVDDEPILLQGLLETYDWNSMGFKVVGSAQSGEDAIKVIREQQPHVVLTDIRMKQVTGLMVIEEIRKENKECLFILLSAYRDFEYAQQSVNLGAFAYMLKPIEDEKMQETMANAYRTCMEKIKNDEKYEIWENIFVKNTTGFLEGVVQKYAQNPLYDKSSEEVLRAIGEFVEDDDKFLTLCMDIDIEYKITNPLDYEETRLQVVRLLKEIIGKNFFYWSFESYEGNIIFIIRTKKNTSARELKQLVEAVKVEECCPIVTAISKPYHGIQGIPRSCAEAKKLFEAACASGAGAFSLTEDMEEKVEKAYPADAETRIVNAVRQNDEKKLKEVFVHFIYSLPHDEELQVHYLHELMLKVEFLIKDSYGMTEELKAQFQNYYFNLKNLKTVQTVSVCYKILCGVIEKRRELAEEDEIGTSRKYMSLAVEYIEEHLDDESLSIVSVATQIYLNPVYFGRVFKDTFHMTFKQYLFQKRMERAKRLIEEEEQSMSEICGQVGISNPSYFSSLFKRHTGMLPSEYKKECGKK